MTAQSDGSAHLLGGARPGTLFTALVAALVLQVPSEPMAAQARLPADLIPPPRAGDPPSTVVPGARYDAGELHRLLLGSLYRDLWATPLTVPVLDPAAYRGGLRPVRQGGGFQTLTLHMRDAGGRYYLFRSIDKRINEALPPDLRSTPAGRILQDQTSALHPGGAWVVAPLLDAVGVPSRAPELFVMPDHPVLGSEYRDFVGRTGFLVESPDDGPDGTLRFDGANQVLGAEDWMEEMRSSPAHRVDAENILKARLVDLLVGDPDRGYRQWRWLRYGNEGAWTWRGVPMDRDAAFMAVDGLVGRIARRIEPKVVRFDEGIELDRLISDQPELDRLLLTELDRAAWESVITEVRDVLTDRVLDDAVAALPDGYRAAGGAELASLLRVRRDRLPGVAREFYGILAREVDVQGTAADEAAVVEILPGGDVEVGLYGPRAGATPTLETGSGERLGRYFHRRFLTGETDEVRVYLRGGDDRAVVRGGTSPITIRIVGGSGDDELIDSTAVPGGRVALYDDEGENRLVGGPATRVDRRRWALPPVTAYRLAEGDTMVRDYGGPHREWAPTVDYTDAAGPVVGLKLTRTTWGFRRDPVASERTLSGAVGPFNGGFELAVGEVRHVEGSRTAVAGEVRASRDFTGRRFYGFGNDTPFLEGDRSLVLGDEVEALAEVRWAVAERGHLALGSRVRWLDPQAPPDAPLQEPGAAGSDAFGAVALVARADVDLLDPDGGPRVSLLASVDAHPPLWDATGWFGGADVEARGVLPVGSTRLALRTGVRTAAGAYPFHEAAFIGGRTTLRGFRHDRLAGDVATFGGIEWQVPLTRLTLFTRGDLGVVALADAGRVWHDGASPGGWHHGVGGGIWYRTLGVTGSATWAHGERGRLYLRLGDGL